MEAVLALDTYYKDHWLEIEPERLDRYEKQFQWSKANERLLEPARVEQGQVVADFGCGPGAIAIELARQVGRQFLAVLRAQIKRGDGFALALDSLDDKGAEAFGGLARNLGPMNVTRQAQGQALNPTQMPEELLLADRPVYRGHSQTM